MVDDISERFDGVREAIDVGVFGQGLVAPVASICAMQGSKRGTDRWKLFVKAVEH